jgi:hypothetical protein
MRVLAESRQRDLPREAREARRAAELRNHPRKAARLIESILSAKTAQRPAATRRP